MKRFDAGLVVGKFSPLHLGHERLIKEAAKQCEKLFIISYSNPVFFKCDDASRERWLKSATHNLNVELAVFDPTTAEKFSYLPVPHNDDPAEAHRKFCALICTRYFKAEVDAVFTSEDYGGGFAEYLTKHFAEIYCPSPFAKNLIPRTPVEHVCVDLGRESIPISATKIRAKEKGSERYIPYNVKADLFPRVAILGGESSGKSTLSKALNARLEQPERMCIQEFGRYLWESKNGKLKFQDMLLIAQKQVEMERSAAFWADDDCKMLICDTIALTTEFFSRQFYTAVDPRMMPLIQREYDAYILCEPDFDFVQDGSRQDEMFRTVGHNHFSLILDMKEKHEGAKVLRVKGSVEDRVEQCVRFLQEHRIGV